MNPGKIREMPWNFVCLGYWSTLNPNHTYVCCYSMYGNCGRGNLGDQPDRPKKDDPSGKFPHRFTWKPET